MRGHAELVLLEARSLGGHGSDHETLRVEAFVLGLAGRAPLVLVLVELAPEVVLHGGGGVEGSLLDPGVGPGVVLAVWVGGGGGGTLLLQR